MPVNLIENFQLGTNLPLDARYVVDSVYDVSIYWYPGMQVFQESDQQLYWYDGSIWIPVVDTSLAGNFATIEYVDGSLAVRDASIDKLFLQNTNQDSSINDLAGRLDVVDGSITYLTSWNIVQDGSISYLAGWNISQDSSIEDLRGRLNVVDGSITFLYNWNTAQDASIIKNYDDITTLYDITASLDASIVRIDLDISGLESSVARIDVSLGQINTWNQIQDISISNLDASLDLYVKKTGDTMTGDLIVPGVIVQNDLSVNGNGTFLGNVGIKGDLLVDGSTTFIHSDILDISINWIHLNTGLTGQPPSWLQSGIIVERGDASVFAFLYDETQQEFRIGIVNETDASGIYEDSDTQAVATREDTPINTGLAFWNGSEWRFDTSTGITVGTIVNLRTDIEIIDNSITYLTSWNNAQDASIARIDVSLGQLNTWNQNQDASIIRIDQNLDNLEASVARIDVSLGQLNTWNQNQDASIARIDVSLGQLNTWNQNQDASIVNLDASLDLYVLKGGDTMTGDLIITTDLSVNGNIKANDVSIAGEVCIKGTAHIDTKIHLHPYTNVDASFGDLWIEPSTYNLFYKHPLLSGTIDASSYDLTDRLLRTADDWNAFPDSSTLDNGDRILIEDAQAGYAKKWISAQAFAASATALLYPSYEDFLPEQTTTSTTYINALTLIADPSAKTSTYRIGWTFQLANSKNGKPTTYRVQIDGSTVGTAAVPAVLANAYSNWSGFQYLPLTLDPSGHTVTVDYFADSGSTAYIRNVRLEFRKADTAN